MMDSSMPGASPDSIDLSLPIGFRMALRSAAGARFDLALPASIERNEGTTRAFWSDWQDALRDQLELSGLLFRTVSLDFEKASAAARPGAPLVTYTPASGWIALLASDRKRVQVLRPNHPSLWLDEVESKKSIDPVLFEEIHPWIALEAGFFGGASGGGG